MNDDNATCDSPASGDLVAGWSGRTLGGEVVREDWSGVEDHGLGVVGVGHGILAGGDHLIVRGP
jgi:hypothetical protein